VTVIYKTRISFFFSFIQFRTPQPRLVVTFPFPRTRRSFSNWLSIALKLGRETILNKSAISSVGLISKIKQMCLPSILKEYKLIQILKPLIFSTLNVDVWSSTFDVRRLTFDVWSSTFDDFLKNDISGSQNQNLWHGSFWINLSVDWEVAQYHIACSHALLELSFRT
jgi:hypothetical protein